jgi:membrane protein implicated in regulation of membrane protease activity
MALIPICAIEGSIVNIKQGLKMRKQKIKVNKTIWTRLGTLDFYLDIFNNSLFFLVFVALFVITFHGFYYINKDITYRFVIYIMTMLAYILARKWLRRGFRKLGSSMRKGNLTYTLTQDGIIIKLVKMMDKNEPEPKPVFLRFDEIDELKVFTYREAEAYLKYQVGPDIRKGVNQTKDFIRYVKGEITRPSVYTLSSYGTSTDKRVLIKGKDLFYLITFDKDDISDLLEAYEASRNTLQGNISAN